MHILLDKLFQLNVDPAGLKWFKNCLECKQLFRVEYHRAVPWPPIVFRVCQ